MNRLLRLLVVGPLLMLVDAALLVYFSSDPQNLLWPALLVLVLELSVYRWFPELVRGTWTVSAISLAVLFGVQLFVLRYSIFRLGGPSILVIALLALAFSMSVLAAALAFTWLNYAPLNEAIRYLHRTLRFTLLCLGVAILDCWW